MITTAAERRVEALRAAAVVLQGSGGSYERKVSDVALDVLVLADRFETFLRTGQIA